MKPHKDEQKKPEEDGSGKENDNTALFFKIEELSGKLKEAEQKAGEFKELAQRVQAEFENSLKRIEREKKEFQEFAKTQILADLLAVLDSFEHAIAGMQKNGQKESIKGLELLRGQFFSVLEKHGLKKIEAVGKKFNPHFHECYISECVSELPDESITGEIQSGYLLNGRVLRSSKVKVNKLHEKIEEKEMNEIDLKKSNSEVRDNE